MAFDQAAVNTLINNIVSHALKLGIFETVNTHEPKSPPSLGNGLNYSVWVDRIEPIGSASGLNSTSGYVIANGRIHGNMMTKPEDDIDPRILTAATTLIGEYSGDFNFGTSIRSVDLLGMYGSKLMAQAGYLTVSGGMYRVMTITIPVIINDMWTQSP